MKTRKIVAVSLFAIASWLSVGCLAQPDEGTESDRAEQPMSGARGSDGNASSSSTAAATGKVIFVTERPCDDRDCTERGCFCNGPFCNPKIAEGQACSFRGECIVRRQVAPPPDDLGKRGTAKVFFCEYQ